MQNSMAVDPRSHSEGDVSANHTPASRSLLRRVMPPIAGFVLIAVLSNGTDEVLRALGVFPPFYLRMSDALFALATAYRFLFSIAGCALAARLADRPMRAAYALAGIGVVLSGIGLIANLVKPEIGPLWYPAALVVMTLPCAWLGGKLGAHR